MSDLFRPILRMDQPPPQALEDEPFFGFLKLHWWLRCGLVHAFNKALTADHPAAKADRVHYKPGL